MAYKIKHNLYYEALKEIEEIVKSATTIDSFTISESYALKRDCIILWGIVNLSIPHKPCPSYKGVGKCYTCNNDVTISENFCSKCGQALDWSE